MKKVKSPETDKSKGDKRIPYYRKPENLNVDQW